VSALAKCQSCGAGMLWAGMPGGARMPLDPEPSMSVPTLGLVAYFNGRGRMVADLEEASAWAERGATFHVAHFSSCSGASGHRGVSRAQEAMF
jgi:hypothetical protein